MGKKLTVKQINQSVKNFPMKGFDTCAVCDGTEIEMSMTQLDELDNTFDLICDECLIEKTKKDETN